jgi:Ca2+/Na+ antiporter
MIDLIFIAAGVFILIKGRIGVDEKRYLQRPKSVYVGVVLVILGVLLNLDVNVFLVLALFVLTVVVAYYTAEKTDTTKPELAQDGEKKSSDGDKV